MHNSALNQNLVYQMWLDSSPNEQAAQESQVWQLLRSLTLMTNLTYMQVRVNLRCHQGWFDWVNEYNFQAGLQTWPNLNSQQRKSGWIEFSLSVINTRMASLEKVDYIRISSLFQSKMEQLNCVQPEFWSKSIIFLLFVLTSPRSKSITWVGCWVRVLEGGFVLHETILASGQIGWRREFEHRFPTALPLSSPWLYYHY